jgi:hypothetical protein
LIGEFGEFGEFGNLKMIMDSQLIPTLMDNQLAKNKSP